MPDQPTLQLKTLCLYGELLCRREAWPHKLTLAAFEGASATGLAAASTLAGAASLTVDSDNALVKAHFRDGAFDFIVNTLDEALRALKNEIRQGRPIAIGLMASPALVLEEAADRGLAADVVVDGDRQKVVDYQSILAQDALRLTDTIQPTSELRSWLEQRGWYSAEISAGRAHFADPVRQRWLQNLPALQRSVRSAPRFAWLTVSEGEILTPPR